MSKASLEKLMSLLSTRNLNEVTAKYLSNQGFSKFDVGISLVSLKFLGLLDEKGKTTEIAKKLHLQGKPREEAYKTIVNSAYSTIFRVVPEAHKLSGAGLSNEFVSQYDLSPRVAKAATPAFLWLCGEAGLIDKSVSPTPRKAVKIKNGNRPVPIEDKKTKENFALSYHKKTKLDIVADFVQKLDIQNTETLKIQEVSNIIKDLLKSVDGDNLDGTKTSSESGLFGA